VTSPAGLADRVEALLVRSCCDLIGLARRAGLAVAGVEKVREAVRSKKAGLLLLALDAAEGGRRKMHALGRDLPVAIVLTATEMGAVFGRDHVVNTAIGDGPLSSRLVAIAEKIAGFRSGALVDCCSRAGSGRVGPKDDGV
jgi:ribosomal protein L7Ae-like RNA K-turn-binding protein